MKIQSIAYVGIAVESIETALPHYQALGLPLVDRARHPTFHATVAVLGTGHGAIALLEPDAADSPIAEFLGARGQGIYHVAFEADRIDDEFANGPSRSRASSISGPSVIQTLQHGGHQIEVVTAGHVSRRDQTSMRRVESVVWSAASRAPVADELITGLGLEINRTYSDLLFPDLQSTNTMLMTGPDSYIDVNEPTDPSAPVARRLAQAGNAIYAIVLEPWDFDMTCKDLARAGVPTVTQTPIDLRAEFPDGANRSAARILSLDRKFTAGARIFISEPTFPWQLE